MRCVICDADIDKTLNLHYRDLCVDCNNSVREAREDYDREELKKLIRELSDEEAQPPLQEMRKQ